MASISSVDGEGDLKPWWESGLEEGGEYLKVCAYVLRYGKDSYKVHGDLLFCIVLYKK